MNEREGAATVAGRARGERGAGFVEYALLVALIAVACIVAITFLGDEASKNFSRNGSSVNEAGI